MSECDAGERVVEAKILLPWMEEGVDTPHTITSFTHCFENMTAIVWFEFTDLGLRFGACVNNNDRTRSPRRAIE